MDQARFARLTAEDQEQPEEWAFKRRTEAQESSRPMGSSRGTCTSTWTISRSSWNCTPARAWISSGDRWWSSGERDIVIGASMLYESSSQSSSLRGGGRMRKWIGHGDALTYEFLSSADQAEVVQDWFERQPEPADLRRALKEHFACAGLRGGEGPRSTPAQRQIVMRSS